MSIEGLQALLLAEHSEAKPVIVPPLSSRRPHISMRHFVDAASLLLALTAIVYAYKQKQDSGDLLAQSNKVQENTQRLVAGMTTQYVAPFPLNIQAIAHMIDNTCSQLDVMVDVPGYGHYSSPELFHRYTNSIEERAGDDLADRIKMPDCVAKGIANSVGKSRVHPRIRLILFSPEDRFSSSSSQFGDIARDLAKDVDGSETAKFTHFFELHRDLIASDPTAFLNGVKRGLKAAEFRHILLNRHCALERELRNSGVQIRYSKQQFITRIWIVDHKEAAFSFDHKNVTETAFRTADKDLVQNFDEIFASWWKDSVPYRLYWKARNADPNYKLSEMQSGGESDDPLDFGKIDTCESFNDAMAQKP
jgi:hypothetical protein